MTYDQWTGLFRSIDLRDSAIRRVGLIAMATAAVRLALSLLGDEPLVASLLSAFAAGFAVATAWVVTRELDPDHRRAATVAAVVCVPLAFFVDLSSVLPVFLLIGLMRVLNRTPGLEPKITDSLALLAITGWLIWQQSVLFGIITAVAFALDALLPNGRQIQGLFGATAVILGLTALAVNGNAPLPVSSLWLLTLALLLISGVFTLVIANTYQLDAVGDRSGEPLQALRVQAAQSVALGAGLLFASWYAIDGVLMFAPLWAALVAVLLWRVWSLRTTGEPLPN